MWMKEGDVSMGLIRIAHDEEGDCETGVQAGLRIWKRHLGKQIAWVRRDSWSN